MKLNHFGFGCISLNADGIVKDARLARDEIAKLTKTMLEIEMAETQRKFKQRCDVLRFTDEQKHNRKRLRQALRVA